MSILIKDMKMPKNCDNCPCYYETEGAWRNECQVVRRECEIEESRPSWCPLIELPPHGRLIDADALMKRFEDAELSSEMHGREFTFSFLNNAQVLSTEWYFVDQLLDDAPTIVEAEVDDG